MHLATNTVLKGSARPAITHSGESTALISPGRLNT